MIKDFVVYNSTGRIWVTGCSEDSTTAALYPNDHVLFEPGRELLDYVDLSGAMPEIKPCEAMPITVSGTTLSNIAVPATLTLKGPVDIEVALTEPEIVLTADLAGHYTLKIVADDPRWLVYEAEIDL